jgi:hypothetical protein
VASATETPVVRIGGRGFGKWSVASLFGNGLRSFRTFLANGFGVAAASARSLNFSPLNAITPFDLDARDRNSYRRPLFDGGPILRSGRQRSRGDEYCG